MIIAYKATFKLEQTNTVRANWQLSREEVIRHFFFPFRHYLSLPAKQDQPRSILLFHELKCVRNCSLSIKIMWHKIWAEQFSPINLLELDKLL